MGVKPTPLLLDTHAFIYALTSPEQLGPHSLALIQDPEQRVCVSAISAWEVSTKTRLGKLPAGEKILHRFEAVTADMNAELIDVSARHAVKAGLLNWEHRDPFDRMLVAVSILEGMTLVTKDKAIMQYQAVDTTW